MPSSLCIVSQDYRGALPAVRIGCLAQDNCEKKRPEGPLRFIEPTWQSLNTETRMAEE